MKINNSLKNPRWYGIECKCNHDSVETEYPIADCLHCKFQECEDSLPKENFEVKEMKVEKKGNKFIPTGETVTRTIKEITIVRGKKFEDIIGWTW